MDWTQIIVTIITVCVPALVTILSTQKIKTQANKHACRQSILQLILEDKISVMEGKIPENYKSIMDEYDEYHQCHGNHYIDEKVEDYKKWYENFSNSLKDKGKEDK